MSDTWVAVDDLGRMTPMNDSVGDRSDREVGMFYFVCQTGDDGTLYDTTRQFRQGGKADVMANIPEAGSPHFWNESYFLVRKDMRGRYPKHDWPEDPWQAVAHRGVRAKKST